MALDGHADRAELTAKVRDFAPAGVDGLLATAGGEGLEPLLPLVRPGGRLAPPNGAQPVPEASSDVQVQAYDGEMSREQLERLNGLIAAGPFEVYIAERFPLAQAAQAHERLRDHLLGKLALSVGS